MLLDRNYTYISSFGTNHGWIVGGFVGDGAGLIVYWDTSHTPVFYSGTRNVSTGGMSLSKIINMVKNIYSDALYIKPDFTSEDDIGQINLQFDVEPNLSLAYLYGNIPCVNQ